MDTSDPDVPIHPYSQPVHCSLEQWDIYKIDPFYDCTVYPYPRLSTIAPHKSTNSSAPSQSSTQPESQSQSQPNPQTYSKRQASPASSDSDVPQEIPTKKAKNVRVVDVDSDDESEVAEMITDEATTAKPSGRAKERRDAMKENQKLRREKNTARRSRQNTEDLRMRDLSLEDIPVPSSPFMNSNEPQTTSPPSFKRTWDDSAEERNKRARTASPTSLKNRLASKLKERQNVRLGRFQERKKGWRDAREQLFMESLYQSFANATNGSTSSNGEFKFLSIQCDLAKLLG